MSNTYHPKRGQVICNLKIGEGQWLIDDVEIDSGEYSDHGKPGGGWYHWKYTLIPINERTHKLDPSKKKVIKGDSMRSNPFWNTDHWKVVGKARVDWVLE